MTILVLAVILGALVVLAASRWRELQRDAVEVDRLIAANKATPRPGMERRDQRFEIVSRREAR